jgi:tetratricopeptide (TPR) repeat protein
MILPGELAYNLDKIGFKNHSFVNMDNFISFMKKLLKEETKPERVELIVHGLGKALFFTGRLDELLDDYWQYSGGVTIYRAVGLLLKGLSRDCTELLNFNQQFPVLENDLKLELAGAAAFTHTVLRNEFEVLKVHELATKVFKSSPELITSYLWCLERYSYNLRTQGNHDLARKSYQLLLDHCLATNTIIFRILGYKGLGHLAEQENDLEKALAFYDRALNISEQSGLHVFDPIILNRKGISVISKGDPSKARTIFEKALEQARTINAPWLELGPLANLTVMKMQEWKLEEAREDFIFLRDFQRDFGDRKDLYWILLNLSAIDASLGDLIKAKRHLHEANHVKEQYKLVNMASRTSGFSDQAWFRKKGKNSFEF